MTYDTHVLIVEDNDDNREIFATILEHAGYRVSRAATGPDGLHAAETLHPDLVLLDLQLPGLDGWEIARRLREDAATAAIRILIVTANAQSEDHLRARELDCLGLLEKPIDPREVREAVRTHLAQPEAHPA